MNKFIAVSLPILWLSYCFFHDHEYGWILRSLVGLNIGYTFAYVWKYHDLKNELFKKLEIEADELVTK